MLFSLFPISTFLKILLPMPDSIKAAWSNNWVMFYSAVNGVFAASFVMLLAELAYKHYPSIFSL